jgi:hypothetical protein
MLHNTDPNNCPFTKLPFNLSYAYTLIFWNILLEKDAMISIFYWMWRKEFSSFCLGEGFKRWNIADITKCYTHYKIWTKWQWNKQWGTPSWGVSIHTIPVPFPTLWISTAAPILQLWNCLQQDDWSQFTQKQVKLYLDLLWGHQGLCGRAQHNVLDNILLSLSQCAKSISRAKVHVPHRSGLCSIP